MRIYYLINGFNGGGAALPIPDIVELMRNRGHEVKIYGLMRQDGKACARLEKAGVHYEILGKGKGNAAASFPTVIRSVRRALPDVIWTSLTRATLYGQLAGKFLGIPVVSWQHSAYLKPLNRVLLRVTRNLSWRWITDSENVREFAIRELRIRPEKVSIWPMFHAVSGFPQSRPWLGHGPIRVGTLGRLHSNKRFDCLIRVAAEIKARNAELSSRIEFVIGGTGPELEQLQQLAEELGAHNVRFAGYVENPAEFLRELHIYIQTSHHEGLCIAAHEAMLSALPVVATRVGQLRYTIMEGETGLLCEVGDVGALADAVIFMAQNPARAHAMGVAARGRVMSLFSEEKFHESGERLLDVLESGFCPSVRSASR